MQNLFLIGFMGSGKSTLGPILAQKLGWSFVDLDARLTDQAGSSVQAIFASEGEAGYRAREARALAEVAADRHQVVATGGGAVLDPANRARMRAQGAVVALEAPLEQLWERVRGSSRPLAGDFGAFARRHAERADCYRGFGAPELTMGDPEVVAERLLARLQGPGAELTVELGDRSYPLVIAPGSLGRLGSLMAERLRTGPCLVVTNPTVEALYGEAARMALEMAGWQPLMAQVPDAEGAKAIVQAERLWTMAAEAGLDRHSPIVALGGGVVGDLAGFVAATYMRGVPLVQVPTTLLAQIDSSVGGKVAINHPRGKNLIGAFHQPSLVVCDPRLLHSLDPREVRSGLSELAKMGVILDPDLFGRLEADLQAWWEGRLAAMIPAIARACELKAAIVAADERESGPRALLNFGHTVGHALEAVTSYRIFRHGEAVAIGMIAASRLARRLGLLKDDLVERLERWLTAAGLPRTIEGYKTDELLTAMKLDKKALAGRLVFVVPSRLGEARVVQDVPEAIVAEVLRDLGAS